MAIHRAGKLLLSEISVNNIIKTVSNEISYHYISSDIKVITVIPVLTGGMFFCCDLLKNIKNIDFNIQPVKISSYGKTQQSGDINFDLKPHDEHVNNNHILIIDDICDTGKTIKYLKNYLMKLQPASIKTCCFLAKNNEIDFIGYKMIQNSFVYGYGLDLEYLKRNLPAIYQV